MRHLATVVLGALIAQFAAAPVHAQCSGATINCTAKIADPEYTKLKTYTLGASENDCNARLLLGGDTFYAIGVAGGYPSGCKVWLTNTDPMPTGSNNTGAKYITFVNCDAAKSGTYLWPQQTMEVTYTTGAVWLPTRCPGRWEAPNGTFTINVDPTSGSDTWGAADGLALTTRAFKSVNYAYDVAGELMDENFLSQTQMVFKLCASCTDFLQLHLPSHGAPIGSQGGAAQTIDCNGGTLAAPYPTLSTFFAGTILGMQNCTVQNGMSINYGSIVELKGGNTFDPVRENFSIAVNYGSGMYSDGSAVNVAGGTGYGFLQAGQGAWVYSFPVNLLGNVTWTGGAGAAGYYVGAAASIIIGTWTLNGFSVTGQKYYLVNCGIGLGVANAPGTVAGIASCMQAN